MRRTVGNHDKTPQKPTPVGISPEHFKSSASPLTSANVQRAQRNARSAPLKAPEPNLNNSNYLVQSTHRNNPEPEHQESAMIRLTNHRIKNIQKFPTPMFNIRTDEYGTRHICVGSIPGRPIEQHEEVIQD